ncbi:MAG: hypothetical protein AAB588_06350 [Patescibacteria group bacterium]
MNKKSLAAATVIFGMLLQTATVFAAGEKPSADFFETAWQEATASQAYGFVCSITSSSPKAASNSLTGDQKKLVDLTFAALKRYKRVEQGTLLGEKHKISTSFMSLNTLRILDQMAAGQFDLEKAAEKMKELKKQNIDLVLADNSFYYKGDNGWKTFQDADLATNLYNGVLGSPFTKPLEKNSFTFKNYKKSGKSQMAIYSGTLTSAETTSLLKPFMGEDEAKKRDPAPVELFITGDGHIKKLNVVDKVVVGGLSFTVKEQCDLKLKGMKIKIQSGATLGSKQELIELLTSIL